MATIFDTKEETKTVATSVAAEQHNAQIKERFQRLQSVERSQLAELASDTTRASVLAPERPAQAQSPMQHVEERVVSPVFTAETLDRTLQNHAAVMEMAPVMEAAVENKAEGVQLSRFAKVFMGACAAAIVGLVCGICALTQVVNTNNMKISAQEARNAQLRTEYAQAMETYEQVTSPEAIEQYAKEFGMTKVN